LVGMISGVGLGTPIGPFKADATDCIRSSSGAGVVPPLAFSTTSLVLTASNGDLINISYSGTGEFSPIGLLILNGTFKIEGGTGIFVKAKGKGTLSGVEDISTVPARGFVSLVGRINY
ncbi:MAG: hypothetical protein ABIV63_19755, partial [Caldimonas sp.]